MQKKWVMAAGLVGLCGMVQAGLVTISNAGNAADTADGDPYTAGVQRYGAVSYTYKISATEVTIAEFQASGAGSGNENHWNTGGYSVGTDAPATFVSLYEAMKYCNWLTSGNINLGAYKFSGGVYQSTDRASAVTTYGTVYALPTEDEWYKAAYFKPNASGYSLYANGTGTAPTTSQERYNGGDYTWMVGTGLAEQNGTYDITGNVWEWMEGLNGIVRGGGYYGDVFDLRSSDRHNVGSPSYQNADVGFRVVAIPEPSTVLLLGTGGLVVWAGRRKLNREAGTKVAPKKMQKVNLLHR